MPDPTEDEHAQRLLIEALRAAEIPERNNQNWLPPLLGGTAAYWEKTNRGIAVVFRSVRFGGGQFDSSIFLEALAKSEIQRMANQDEVLSVLVDTLRYLRVVVSEILPWIDQHLLARSFNKLDRKTQRILKKSGLKSGFQIDLQAHLSQRLKAAQDQLRAEPRSRRGGSSPRLAEKKRSTLHTQYDHLHRLAKRIKRDYDIKLKAFQKARKAKGYSHKEWRDHWMKDAQEFPEEIKRFVALFARVDSPSASEVAYITLAAETGHKRSYLPRLISESRKAAKNEIVKPKE